MTTTWCAAPPQQSLAAATAHADEPHAQEKLDHLGIVALVIGTPMSAIMVR